MLIEPNKWEYTFHPNTGNYTLKLTALVTSEQMFSAQEALYIFIRDKKEKCDMVCPMCGGSLSC